MPLTINPAEYGSGVGTLQNLAAIAGTINGEVRPGGNVQQRAAILDSALNRVNNPDYTYNHNGAGGTSGVALYMTDPHQYSTWLASQSDALQNATNMQSAILALAKNPALFDTYSPSFQKNIVTTLQAVQGVMGTGDLRGMTGGATNYISPKGMKSSLDPYVRKGLNQGTNIGGNVFFGENQQESAAQAAAAKKFDFSNAYSTLVPKLSSGLPGNVLAIGQEAVNLKPPTAGSDGFGSAFATTAEQADPAIAAAYQNIFGRDPDAAGRQAGESFLTHGDLGAYVTNLLASQEARNNTSGVPLPGVADLLSTIRNTPGVQLGDGATPGQGTEIATGRSSGTIGDPNFGAGIVQPGNVGSQAFAGAFSPTAAQADPAIAAAYQNIFGRAPDAAGLSAGENFLTHGDLGTYVTNLLASQEAKNNASGAPLPGVAQLLDTIRNTQGVAGNFNLPQLPGASGTGGLPSTEVSTQGPGGTTPTLPAFDNANPIGSLYQAILQRPGDASGIQSFDAQLNAGKMDLNQIVSALRASPEAQALGPTAGQNVPTFSAADTVYARDFGRLADAGGRQNFDAQVAAGLPQNVVEAQLLGSQEAQSRGPDQLAQLVNNYNTTYGIDTGSAARLLPYAQEFQQATGRAMDVPTQQVWASQINAGTSPAILEAGLLMAPEAVQARTGSLDDLSNQFKAKYGLTPEQVQTLAPAASEFQQVLGRPVDVPTLQNWASQNTALPLLQAQILGSQEAQARGPDVLAPLVNQFTQQYGFNPTQALTTISPLASTFEAALGRAPDVPTLQTWANASAQGQGLGQLTAGLLQAPEVQARTGGQGTLFQQFGSQYGMNPASYLQSLAPTYTPPGISDWNFSTANVGGALGAQPQSVTSGLGGGGGGYIPDGGAGTVEEGRSTPEFEGTGTGGLGDAAGPAAPDPYAGAAAAANSFNSAYANYLRDTANGGAAPEQTNPNVWNQQLAAQDAARQAQMRATTIANLNHMGGYGPTLGGFTLGGFSNVGTYVAPGGMIG